MYYTFHTFYFINFLLSATLIKDMGSKWTNCVTYIFVLTYLMYALYIFALSNFSEIDNNW